MAELPLLTGTRLGNYRLERLIGRGRMGVVYLARDEALLRPTAVKILSWAFAEGPGDRAEDWLLAEARHVARINHPAVVQVYNVAKHAGYCYIAMEYVEGLAGDVLVAKRGRLSPADATQIALQLAGALDSAHASDVVHRDVKPANVLVKPDGTCKLGDFGMAMQTQQTGVNAAARAHVGTPLFLAPETWLGASASVLTDIYALGATYYFFLTGQPPFEAADSQTLGNLHRQGPIPDPGAIVPGLPASCSHIIRRCLAKAPEERYQAARELGWELRGALRDLHAEAARLPAAKAAPAASSSPGPSTSPAATDAPTIRPFGEVTAEASPYRGEPHRSLLARLEELLGTRAGVTVVLSGGAGSGRTTVARRATTAVAAQRAAAFLDLSPRGEGNLPAPSPSGRTFLQRACRALGALPSASAGSDTELEGIVEQLSGSEHHGVLAVDPVPPGAPFLNELGALARAAHGARCLTLLVVGGPELAAELQEVGHLDPEAIVAVELPPLDPLQTSAYVAAWLTALRPPAQRGFIATPDAALLMHHRAGGNLARLNALARHMLRLAGDDDCHVLSSWLAWTSPGGDGEGRAQPGITHLPPGWPTVDVLEILNQWRRQAGLPARQPTTRAPRAALER